MLTENSYIKELADRLQSLEQSMQPGDVPSYAPMQDNQSPQVPNDFSPTPASNNPSARKRTFSASNEYGDPNYPMGHRPSVAWAQQDSPRQANNANNLYATPQVSADQPQSQYRPHYSPNGIAPQPVWRDGPDMGRQPSISYDNSQQVEHGHAGPGPEWDEAVIDECYSAIYPTYPFLSSSKRGLGQRLGRCPPLLSEAFLEALYAAVRSSPTSNIPQQPERQGLRHANELLSAYQWETATTRNLLTNTIHLQTLIFMAIEADNHGVASLRGQQGRSIWLGSAVALAYSMKLHILRTNLGDADADSDEKMARRTWWTLVIMDRWHAASTASPVLIPEASIVLLPEDQALLGETPYHLARKSNLVRKSIIRCTVMK